MILVDFSQIFISSFMTQNKIAKGSEDYMSFVRHLVLNTLRHYKTKFKNDGEMVICCDGPNSWRKDYFPLYKGSRKKMREDSSVEWSKLFDSLSIMKEELKNYFPYKVLSFDRVEADDIIATLAKKYHTKESIVIVSGDKDFIQLQRFKNVKQFSPVINKLLKSSEYGGADVYLKTHIITGDRGDGIPNILSADNSIMEGIRQKPITKKKIQEWVTQTPQDFCSDEMFRNYLRNEQIINLVDGFIPKNYVEIINDGYDNYPINNGKQKIFNYFVKNKLKNLMDSIQEF